MLYQIGRPNLFLQQLIAAGLPKLTTSAPVTINRLGLGDAFTDTSRYYTYAGFPYDTAMLREREMGCLKVQMGLSCRQSSSKRCFGRFSATRFSCPLQKRNQRVVRATLQ